MTLTREQKLADRLVRDYNLTPPIDVMRVLNDFADVEELEWKYSSDGLVRGLASPRPKVFLRKNVNRRRLRFTASHELGHIACSWHLESELACHMPGGLSSLVYLSSQEVQANRFASSFLIPRQFLSEVLDHEADPGRWLKELTRADVSAAAGLIALSEVLLPGFLFVIEEADGLREIPSSGTRASVHWVRGIPDFADLEKRSVAYGRESHQSRQVRWYQLINIHEPNADDDPRSTTDLLRSALDRVGTTTRDGRQLLNVVTGWVGGATGKHAGRPARELLGILEHAAAQNPDTAQLLDDDDFRMFLSRRANEISRRSN